MRLAGDTAAAAGNKILREGRPAGRRHECRRITQAELGEYVRDVSLLSPGATGMARLHLRGRLKGFCPEAPTAPTPDWSAPGEGC